MSLIIGGPPPGAGVGDLDEDGLADELGNEETFFRAAPASTETESLAMVAKRHPGRL